MENPCVNHGAHGQKLLQNRFLCTDKNCQVDWTCIFRLYLVFPIHLTSKWVKGLS